eukprot:CAMPEP_0203745136 /NCGR_PEP_ID=MMETSP0098-20131031/972_1 /ASSEMBLY_ACC=CAM_ASM_000208 /TAXON_ID=96639 /ORGANISM=" , Strain NY0313808BC1" /LENGTH=365 /DNA_ID=CAMNT_0050632835 /DNA_START=869 /DNA_END=1963 /DNA_ORIENTATION=-
MKTTALAFAVVTALIAGAAGEIIDSFNGIFVHLCFGEVVLVCDPKAEHSSYTVESFNTSSQLQVQVEQGDNRRTLVINNTVAAWNTTANSHNSFGQMVTVTLGKGSYVSQLFTSGATVYAGNLSACFPEESSTQQEMVLLVDGSGSIFVESLPKVDWLSLSIVSADNDRGGEILVGNIDNVKSLSVDTGNGYIGITATSAPALENVTYAAGYLGGNSTTFLLPGSNRNDIRFIGAVSSSFPKKQIYLGENGLRPAKSLTIRSENALGMLDACHAPVENVSIEGSAGNFIVAPQVNLTVQGSANRTMSVEYLKADGVQVSPAVATEISQCPVLPSKPKMPEIPAHPLVHTIDDLAACCSPTPSGSW